MRNWYKRTLYSYLPVFVIIVSFLFFMFFYMLSLHSKREAEQANRAAAQQRVQMIDGALRNIDYMVITELLTNPKLQAFFYSGGTESTFVHYDIVRALHLMQTNNPLIDSLYLVRLRDNKVLSPNTIVPLEQYEDYPYLAKIMEQPVDFRWSNVRPFREFAHQKERKVVTLIRNAQMINGQRGFMVVNVRPEGLKDVVENIVRSKVSASKLVDRDGQVVFGDESEPYAVSLSSVPSEYTGWRVESGFLPGAVVWSVSAFSPLWIAVGLIAVSFGVVWIVYVTKRNYRPIELLLNRVQDYTKNKSELPRQSGNEFQYIEQAMDHMIAQSTQFQQQLEQDSALRKKYAFLNWIEGAGPISGSDLADMEKSAHGNGGAAAYQAAVIEIDRFKSWERRFSPRDQSLLKFALQQVWKEHWDACAVGVWGEWTSSGQYSAVLLFSGDRVPDRSVIQPYIQWVRQHLPFTVTIGIGEAVDDAGQVPESYKEACRALGHKASIGCDGMIAYADLKDRPEGTLFKHIERFRTVVHLFRVMDPDWRVQYDQTFDAMQEDELPHGDIAGILNFLIYQLGREMDKLAPEYRRIWERQARTALADRLDDFETIGDIRGEFGAILQQMYDDLSRHHEERGKAALIRNIRSFIEERYMDPNISLNALSDQFGIKDKYVSKLFREEFGENFVDFLIELRMERAKRLLVETDMPLQELAEQVGYSGAISLSRAFKKYAGFSPGDYRKQHGGDRTETDRRMA